MPAESRRKNVEERTRQTDGFPFVQVIEGVKDDHARILNLFRQFHSASEDNRRKIVDFIFQELETHFAMEEEWVYPALAESGIEGKQVAQGALAEHAAVKTAIGKLRNIESDDDDAIDQSFENMMQAVRQHFETEERSLMRLAGKGPKKT